MEIGLGPLGSAWMCWATALADPLIPEPVRARLLHEAASASVAHHDTWFTLAARIAIGLGFYITDDDEWRRGPPYVWAEDTDPANRFEWETDILPTPTPAASIIIQWALKPPTARPINHSHIESLTTEPQRLEQRWNDCDHAIRCLAARARSCDPLLDLRMTMVEEAWAAWVSLD